MKTGLTKRQKTTCIYFDEASETVEIQTHNTALKKRLTQSQSLVQFLEYPLQQSTSISRKKKLDSPTNTPLLKKRKKRKSER